MTTTQKLILVDGNETREWMEVHRAGCAHITRRRHPETLRCVAAGDTPEHSSLTSAAADFAYDFIAEGSMTVEEARDEHIHFAPCVRLPRFEEQGGCDGHAKRPVPAALAAYWAAKR